MLVKKNIGFLFNHYETVLMKHDVKEYHLDFFFFIYVTVKQKQIYLFIYFYPEKIQLTIAVFNLYPV